MSTDCVIFGYVDSLLQVALIERKQEPFLGYWALPGGFMEGDETAEQCALRELQEETGIQKVHVEQFHLFSAPERDPRGRVLTLAFFALVDPTELGKLEAGTDASKALWCSLKDLPPLAFDHVDILNMALTRLRDELRIRPLAFNLLPKHFTLTELQRFYEEVFQEEIDKRNFRKKMAKVEYIVPTSKNTSGVKHRPAQLYRFDKKIYQKTKGL